MTNTASPGWYVDPSDPTVEHWWDGTAYNGTRTVAGSASYSVAAVSPKSRAVASILGFFLGGLGVDRFYLGNVGMGVAKLLLGWLTLGIWPLVDWIIILAGGAHDGRGLPVTNWD